VSEPPAPARLDLHTHGWERSLDSGASALALAQRAAACGLDGICLTDHNALCPTDEARALSEQCGIAVIPGMEVGTDIGHVLAFGLDRFRPELVRIEQLRRIALAEGAVLVWAHPMRELHLPRPDWDQLPALFDALEVVNGDHQDRPDGYLAGLAQRLGLGCTAGSDAHSIQAIGRVATAFPAPVRDLRALIAALRAHAHEALDLRAHSPAE
jgi:predicted metal-dependent phosphoesterase TrpH